MFKRVLIANRGEIAIRIARAAASLGVDSVAVFTPADAQSLHTKLADKAFEIGKSGGDPLRAYLDIEAVIAAAKESGADCVHPGYGFLSENAGFAERCRAEGLRFIGPSPAALALFGDKVAARAFAEKHGIPVVPGAPALGSSEEAKATAQKIGYPVMLKASAGGGGRAGFGKGGVLRQEAVARMDAVGATLLRRRDHGVDVEIDAQRIGVGLADLARLVREFGMQRLRIRSREHGDRFDPERRRRPGDANGDLAAVGDQHALEHRRFLSLLVQTLPHPRSRAPGNACG
jgi:hypothetical protein